jgi:hypothetical protein
MRFRAQKSAAPLTLSEELKKACPRCGQGASAKGMSDLHFPRYTVRRVMDGGGALSALLQIHPKRVPSVPNLNARSERRAGVISAYRLRTDKPRRDEKLAWNNKNLGDLADALLIEGRFGLARFGSFTLDILSDDAGITRLTV